MAFSPNAETVYADGPSLAPRQPPKSEIRALLKQYETIIDAFTSNGGLIYTSKASMDADLLHGAKTSAWVIGDATVANNGIYQKQGASGAGSWTRVADLPYSFIIASDVGAGSPNNIQATTSIPVTSSALVWLNIFEANSGSPVTVSFNGGTALTIKTNSGSNIAVGGLVSDMIALGVVSGSTFRLVSDQASAALLAAAEGYADAAAASAAAAAASALSVDAVGIEVRDDTYRIRGLQRLKQDNGPILAVMSGQSNAIGSNNETTGTVDTDAGVFIWNTDTDDWQMSEPGVPAGPFTYNTIGVSFPKPNNIAHQMALRLRRETGREVYIVLDARGSTSITEWTTGWTVRDMFGALSSKVAAALASPELTGKARADVVLWHQGEQDAGMSTSTYRGHFYDVYARFTAASWFSQYQPFICGELALNTIYDTQNDLHSSHDRRGIKQILTAKALGLAVDSSGVHFTGEALEEMGYTRFFNAYASYLANPPALDLNDIYTGGVVPFMNTEDIYDVPVSAKSVVDILTSTPDGIRSGTSPFTDLEGKLGYRTLIRSSLVLSDVVPTDMPGGHFRCGDNVELPGDVFIGYTVKLTSTKTTGSVVITPPVGGTIDTSSTLILPLFGDSVTLVAYDNDGLSWFLTDDSRQSLGGHRLISIADDAAVAIVAPANCGKFSITGNPFASSPNIQHQGTFGYDVGATVNIAKWSGGTLAVAVAGDVTGTTGTDGQINVGGVAGSVKVENRTGGTIVLAYSFLA